MPTERYNTQTAKSCLHLKFDETSVTSAVANETGLLDGVHVNYVTGYFVDPAVTGTNGDGSDTNPWNIDYAFTNPGGVIGAGDTLYLREGTYSSPGSTGWDIALQGDASNRITVQNYPGESVTIDLWDGVAGAGAPTLQLGFYSADYVTLQGVEITNTNPRTRFTTETDQALGSDEIGRGQINLTGTDNRLVNCVIHDLNIGILSRQEGVGGEVYGCIIWSCGWDTPTAQWDNTIYAKNTGPTRKYFTENICFNSFAYGIAVFGGPHKTDNVTLTGNICFQNSYAPGGTVGGNPGYFLRGDFLIGGTQPITGAIWTENYSYSQDTDFFSPPTTYNNDVIIGFSSGAHTDIELNSNYFYSGEVAWPGSTWTTVDGDNLNVCDQLTGTGKPTGSQFTEITAAAQQTAGVNKIDVRPNAHETGRGHVVIYNWAGDASDDVDLSTILEDGANYEIYHVYDLGAPVASGTFSSASPNVTIPLADKTPPTILGDVSSLGAPVVLPKEFSAFLVITTSATGYFVTPSGGSTNPADGDINNPWSLAYALTNPGSAISAGDTVWLRGGTYVGGFDSTIAGASGNHIVFRSYPGEWAILDTYDPTDTLAVDTQIQVLGAYTTWRDMEICNSKPALRAKDVEQDEYQTDPDLQRGGLYCRTGSDDTKFINLVVHDMTDGIGFQGGADGDEICYGCIVYNNGFVGRYPTAPIGWEHGIYTYNDTGTKVVENCAVFNNFSTGLHTYAGSLSQFLLNIILKKTTSFNNGYGTNNHWDMLFYQTNNDTSGAVIQDLNLYNNVSGRVRVGTVGSTDQDVDMQNNYFASANMEFGSWVTATGSGNTLIGNLVSGSPPGFTVKASETVNPAPMVYPNTEEAGRGTITIYNWELNDTVSVDVSSILTSGSDYAVYHVYDLEAPVAIGTWTSGTIAIPMRSIQAPRALGEFPSGVADPIVQTKEFGVFIIKTETKVAPPTGYFVSPNAVTGTGDGSFNKPWTLSEAFGAITGTPPVSIVAGDTIYVRGGTYMRPDGIGSPVGNWDCHLTGTDGNPIVMKPYPGEKAILDLYNPADQTDLTPEVPHSSVSVPGPLRFRGSYFRFMGFEVFSSKPHSRRSMVDDTSKNTATMEEKLRRGFLKPTANGGIKIDIINCVLHDMTFGIATQYEGVGGIHYGNIIYNNGWYGITKDADPGPEDLTLKGREHGWYIQNTGVETKYIQDNITFNNANYGIQLYTQAANQEDDIVLERNCNFNNGMTSARTDFLLGAAAAMGTIVFNNNYSYCEGYGNEVRVGYYYYTSPNGDLTFHDNYLASGDLKWTGADYFPRSVTGNKVVDSQTLERPGTTSIPTGSPVATVVNGDIDDQVFVHPNAYEAGRGHVYIYNASVAAGQTVNVNLDTVLANGANYEVHHVCDLDGTPVASGQYTTGVNVAFPMAASTTAPTALGGDPFPAYSVSQKFGAFLVTTTSAP